MPSIKSVGTVSENVKRKGEERELSIDVDSLAQHPEALAFVVRRFIDRGLQNDLEDRQQTLDSLAEGILPSAGGGGSRISYRVQAIREMIQALYMAHLGYRKSDIKQSSIAQTEADESQAIRDLLEAMYRDKYGEEPSPDTLEDKMAESGPQITEWIDEREKALKEAKDKTSNASNLV